MGELRSLLEREAERFEPSMAGFDRAVTRGRRRTVRRRLMAGGIAVLVATAGFVVVLRAFGGSGRGAAGAPTATKTYFEPSRVWHITYPARFREGPVSIFNGRVSFEGAWVANFAPTFGGPSLQLPSRVPTDGVIVEVVQRSGGPLMIPRSPDTTFPLSPDDLRASGGSSDGWRSADIVANGVPYTLWMNIGPDATDADRAAAASIVSSLGFRPTRPGTFVRGPVDYWVLQAPTLYPIGSVSRRGMPASSFGSPFPFYLVHVRDGFYALAWPDDQAGGYKHCDVRYVADKGWFACPNGARWALDGSVIAKPGPGYQPDRLEVLLVRISLDGDVMVSPNVLMQDAALDLRLT